MRFFFIISENNLIGAAEWTGYASSSVQPSSFPQFSNSSLYGYDTPNPVDHHTNFHLPTVLSDHQSFCPTDYHTPTIQSPTNTAVYNANYSKSTEIVDPLAAPYPSYNNWTNGYNNYQYNSCAPQAQYPPHPTPTLVLYPQLHSTVNQNQIHLHLHGTDKIEQYLNPEHPLTISSVSGGTRGAIEIGFSGSNNENLIHPDDAETNPNPESASGILHTNQENRDSSIVPGDPASVWRPY